MHRVPRSVTCNESTGGFVLLGEVNKDLETLQRRVRVNGVADEPTMATHMF